jgi:hypothetical protein
MHVVLGLHVLSSDFISSLPLLPLPIDYESENDEDEMYYAEDSVDGDGSEEERPPQKNKEPTII